MVSLVSVAIVLVPIPAMAIMIMSLILTTMAMPTFSMDLKAPDRLFLGSNHLENPDLVS